MLDVHMLVLQMRKKSQIVSQPTNKLHGSGVSENRVAQVHKKFPVFLETREFNYHVHNRQPLVTILS
jgi:hypothetical protein